VVEVRAALHEPQRFEIELGASETQTVRARLRRLSTYAGPSRTYFWAATATGGAALVAGAVFGLLAIDSRDEGTERASLHLDTSDQSEHTRQLALAADICFGGALLLAGTATVLYFVTDWSDESVPVQPFGRARTAAGVKLDPSGGARAELAVEFW
jgi:hypothetical protein